MTAKEAREITDNYRYSLVFNKRVESGTGNKLRDIFLNIENLAKSGEDTFYFDHKLDDSYYSSCVLGGIKNKLKVLGYKIKDLSPQKTIQISWY